MKLRHEADHTIGRIKSRKFLGATRCRIGTMTVRAENNISHIVVSRF